MTRTIWLFLRLFQAWSLIPRAGRAKLLKFAGFEVGRTVRIYEGCFFGSPRVRFGSRVFVNAQCFFDTSAPISIGDDVHLAPRVQLFTSTPAIGPSSRRAGPLEVKPITIGAGCWIGAGAMILPGVTIAPGCIVAAGAVVSKSTDPDGVYAGVPARRISEIEQGSD